MPSATPPGQGGPEAITLVVTMSIKPEFEDDFLEMARAFADKVYANEPGVLLYVLTKHPTQEHTYVWVERYRDDEALSQHMGTAHMAEIRPKLEHYLSMPHEAMRLMQVVPEPAVVPGTLGSPLPAGQGGAEAVTLLMLMPIKAEFEDDFLEMTHGFVKKIYQHEPGTLLFILTKHPAREQTYMLVERYRDEAAFQLHRNSTYLEAIRPKLQQYFDGRPELLRLAQVIPG